MPTLRWSDNDITEVRSEDELRKFVLSIANTTPKNHPIIIELQLDNGCLLHMGVGLDRTILSYVPGDGNPPYLPEDEDDESVIEFYYGGEWSEFSIINLIPFDLGLSIFLEFFSTGQLSSKIDWEEV